MVYAKLELSHPVPEISTAVVVFPTLLWMRRHCGFFAGQNCRIVLVQVPALALISDDNLGKLTSLGTNQSFGLWQINPLTGSPKAA